MKKYFNLIIVLFVIITLAGCGSKYTNIDDENKDIVDEEPGIVGYVTDKENGRILVVKTQPLDLSANGGVEEYYEAIWFSNAPDGIDVGERVSVWYSEVLDSYPAQSDIKRIEVVSVQKPEGANMTEPEAINKAISAQQNNDGFFLIVVSAKYQSESGEWLVQLKKAQSEEIYDVILDDADTTQETEENAVPQPLVLDDDLQLGDLKVNMTKQMVMEVMKLGLTKSAKDSASGIESEFLYFDDKTEIHLVEGKIYSLTVFDADYPTPRGLMAGDNAEKLKRLYGEPSYVSNDGTWIYSSKGYDVLFVNVKDDVVESIKVSLVM